MLKIILLFIIFSFTLDLYSEEIVGVCGSRIAKTTQNGDDTYVMKNHIETDCNFKKKNYKIELNVAQINHIITLHLKFIKNFCIEKDNKLIFDFKEGESVTLESIAKAKSCDGVLTYSFSHLLDMEKVTSIVENELTSISIFMNGEKVKLEISEFSLATLKFNMYCFQEIFTNNIE